MNEPKRVEHPLFHEYDKLPDYKAAMERVKYYQSPRDYASMDPSHFIMEMRECVTALDTLFNDIYGKRNISKDSDLLEIQCLLNVISGFCDMCTIGIRDKLNHVIQSQPPIPREIFKQGEGHGD